MTRKEALAILGLPPTATEKEIRKQYHRLLHRVHPDAFAPAEEGCAGGIREIIQAYSVLKKNAAAPETAPGAGWKNFGNRRQEAEAESSRTSSDSKKPFWNAPINENAWMEREVLHYAEDAGGSVIGSFTLARGRYLWTPEEDFPLFLQSLLRCSRELLDKADEGLGREAPAARVRYQAELSYLLAQQFMDCTALLTELARKSIRPDGSVIWYVSAMLEYTASCAEPEPGTPLFPSALRRHRLYVKDADGRELGYLSFRDDRFYYVIVPLFEQRQVRVRLRTAERAPVQGRRKSGSVPLHLWLQMTDPEGTRPPESLNLKIQSLLDAYRREA